jgi:hypothetical protein
MVTRSAYVPQAESKPCLLCSLQNAVITNSFHARVGGEGLQLKLTPATGAVDMDRLRRMDRKIHDQLVLLRVQPAAKA